jgi:hypothetical protein
MLQATASERGLQHHPHMMVMQGSESGLFVATVTTGAAAMAAATMGFYTHEAVARLLLLVGPDNNNAGNARVEGRLSKMEQSMQQQQERETSMLNRIIVSLDVTNAKLGHLDKALDRALLRLPPPPPRSSLAATATRRRALRVLPGR